MGRIRISATRALFKITQLVDLRLERVLDPNLTMILVVIRGSCIPTNL